MGINKRFIDKSRILGNIGNLSYVSNLRRSDIVILMDDWSDNFYKNFESDFEKYQSLRSVIISDTMVYSNLETVTQHANFAELKKLSNILYNLKVSPEWVDILLANSILECKIPDDISGRFDLLVDFFIDRIDNYYR
jgi:hypothetical protein